MAKSRGQLSEMLPFEAPETNFPPIPKEPEPWEKEFCSACGDQEGGCRQCGFGREYKAFLAEQAAKKKREENLARARQDEIDEDNRKILKSFDR